MMNVVIEVSNIDQVQKYIDLYDACTKENLDNLKELLKNEELIANVINWTIETVCRDGFLNALEILLQDNRADPAVRGNFAIKEACLNGHVDVVEMLLQDGRSDPSDGGINLSIYYASVRGYTDIVKLLLQDGRVDPTADDERAIKKAMTEEIKEMLITYKYRVGGKEYCKAKNDLATLDRF